MPKHLLRSRDTLHFDRRTNSLQANNTELLSCRVFQCCILTISNLLLSSPLVDIQLTNIYSGSTFMNEMFLSYTCIDTALPPSYSSFLDKVLPTQSPQFLGFGSGDNYMMLPVDRAMLHTGYKQLNAAQYE